MRNKKMEKLYYIYIIYTYTIYYILYYIGKSPFSLYILGTYMYIIGIYFSALTFDVFDVAELLERHEMLLSRDKDELVRAEAEGTDALGGQGKPADRKAMLNKVKGVDGLLPNFIHTKCLSS